MIKASLLKTTLVLAAILLTSSLATAQTGGGDGDKKVLVDAEYRTRVLRVEPFELSGSDVGKSVWGEHRLRLDLKLQSDLVKVVTQLDILDGVLFGDNGVFGRDPSPISGVSLATKRPNSTRLKIGLPEGADPLNPDSYVPVLEGADPINVNLAYGEVTTPLGLLRVGRQPLAYGANLASHEGARVNRWGVSNEGDVVDRFLFGTKLSEIFLTLRDGDAHVPNMDMNDGLFLGLFYDWQNIDDVSKQDDDLTQMGVALQYKNKNPDWFGLDWGTFRLYSFAVHLSDERFGSSIISFPMRTDGSIGDLAWEFQAVFINGESREISEGFAALSGRSPTKQKIDAMGAFGRVDYKLGPLTLTMEVDYATGDSDPRASTPITSFSFSRDFNVGLLLFEHILAFESARSVAVGIENLSSLDAESFPLTEVQTEGRFNNAIALFPQLKIDMLPAESDHKLHLRLGTLFAWPEADGVVDPIITALAEDGNKIDDDAVNFHGGDPGDYYGTEFDAQLEWSLKETFFLTIEGAALLPGNSLQDKNGDAVPSFLFETRFTYVY